MKVLAEGGRPQDSHLTRLYGFADRMPVFALDYLLDALTASGERRPARGGAAAPHPQRDPARGRVARTSRSCRDPYLLWFWNSNVRSTALVARHARAARARRSAGARRSCAGCCAARKQGRWSNTQENGVALEALVDYYKKAEADAPDFRAVVALGARDAR